MTRKHTNHRMQGKLNNSGGKYINENITKNRMDNQHSKRSRRTQRRLKAEIHIDLLRTTLKKYQIGNHQAMMEYIDSGSRNSPLFMTDYHSKGTDGCKKTHVPEWITKGETTLIQKDPLKGTVPNNYRPIIYLPMMREIQTAQIRKEIYYSLTSRKLFLGEHKRCCKGSRSTGELLYIDQYILNESKTRRKNLAIVSIDDKKAFDMIPHCWIINCLKMYKISD